MKFIFSSLVVVQFAFYHVKGNYDDVANLTVHSLDLG